VHGPDLVVMVCLTLAMGVQNASIHKAANIAVGLTYVTGTLVHFGRALAEALRGVAPWRAMLPYAALWAGLVAGAVLGSAVARWSSVDALGVAGAAAALLAAYAAVPPARIKAPGSS
jgi:uncharacterized membrane protein YoaK (UPF0700 family)